MEHGSIKVLLIEDNPADARFIAEIIRTGRHASRFDLIHKSRLRDGLQYLKESERPVDAILLDLSLPDSQGFDTFLRLLTEASDLPIIVLTGIDDETVATRAVQEGAQDYLVKGQVDGPLLSRSILYAIERKRTEKDLQKQAALLNLAHDAMFVRGLDHTVQFWNDGAVELYGFTREEALGKVTQDLLHTRFPEPIDQIVDQVLESGRWEGELRQTTSVGKELVVESRWALRQGKDGEPTGFLEVNRDITAKKLAEEALRSNMLKLEQLNDELQEFAFIAAHDLQEPLRKIQTFGNILVRKHNETLNPEAQDHMGRMIKAANRMSELLRSLLDYSRSGTSQLNYKLISLTEVAKDAASDLEFLIKKTKGSVEICELPTVDADATLMRQLFQNFIGNSMKYRRESEPPVVKIYGSIVDGTCQVMIEDNGIGFDECYCQQIFKPFQRLHGKNSPCSGIGMGLAICKKIVNRHGGEITVRSIPEQGTTFVVTIPTGQEKGA